MILLLILSIISSSFGAIRVEKIYSEDLTCSGTQTSWIITYPATCTPRATCSNSNNVLGSIVECPASFSSSDLPYGWSMLQLWNTTSSCAGNPYAIGAAPSNTCSGASIGPSFSLRCWSSIPVIKDCPQVNPGCNGCATQMVPAPNPNAGCVAGNILFYQTVTSYNWFCPPRTTTVSTTSGSTLMTTTPATTLSTTMMNMTTTPSNASVLSVSFVLISILLFSFL
tara:strand:- start:5758 stop:6432 length:675 start_codon:yes stop_codon:yes gene_type:complete